MMRTRWADTSARAPKERDSTTLPPDNTPTKTAEDTKNPGRQLERSARTCLYSLAVDDPLPEGAVPVLLILPALKLRRVL